jgi:Ca-activated chloride channel family protein
VSLNYTAVLNNLDQATEYRKEAKMWIHLAKCLCVVTIVIGYCAGKCAAQPSQMLERTPHFKADAERVLIPLSVTDHVGHPILGLGTPDFIVAEGSVAQKVLAVSTWDTPASIGVVFDSSGSMKSSVRRAQAAVRALFRDANEGDEAFLIQFADSPHLEVNFTTDVDQSPGKLLWTAPHGATALFDAVYAGLDQMRQAVNPHKALVIVKD